MNKDFTYCTGIRCYRTKECRRWTGHIKDPLAFVISIAQFADHDGKCENFIELSKKGQIEG